ncbi:hypothetical protein Hanom_Chr03g00225321 [Helianthus anomalus]
MKRHEIRVTNNIHLQYTNESTHLRVQKNPNRYALEHVNMLYAFQLYTLLLSS